MSGYGFTDEEWNHMVCEYHALFLLSIGYTPEHIAEKFPGDLAPGDIEQLCETWAEVVKELPHLASRQEDTPRNPL